MIDQLLDLDRKLFLYLNGIHVAWLDPVMLFITKTLAWLPLYLLLIYFIFKDHKKDGWLVMAGIVLTITLADQVTTSIMKPYFARLRPSQEPTLEALIHLVEGYKGGLYGFASSHAANTFGTATFFWLVFSRTRKWMGWLFLWAAVMTYSRIYLGVHYPGDILVGSIVGVLSAIVGYKFYQWMQKVADKKRMPSNVQ